MARKTASKAFNRARDTRSYRVVSPFHSARLVAIILDAVTAWDVSSSPSPERTHCSAETSPCLFTSAAMPLEHCDRMVKRCARDGEPRRRDRHFECDAFSAQANAVDPNGDSCFFSNLRELPSTQFALSPRAMAMTSRKRQWMRRRRPNLRTG
jgi:hypothetical protein